MMKRQFNIFRCVMAGVTAVESDTRHVFPRHTHDEFGIGVICRGAQKSSSGRGMVEAGRGDTITVNPGEVHDGAPIGDAGRSWRMLYFDPRVIAQATCDISEGNTGTHEFCQPVMSDPNTAARFQRLFSTVTRGDAQNASCRGEELLLDLLADAMREVPVSDKGLSAPAGIRLARCLIDDDPTVPIALADLARASGLSRFQVLRGFVRATGLTPHAYLVQRRIDRARRLIARGSTLAEAATASGFADQSHMTRIFARKYGLSPGAYAKALG